VRETEWEAAQTVALWRDGGETMRWKKAGPVEKAERAELLLLALAALLYRGGERVRLIGGETRPIASLDRLAALLDRLPAGTGLPPEAPLPRHAQVVLIGDFLAPLADIQHAVGRLAAIPVRGHIVQVLDPAEALLPYEGRVRFEGMRREVSTLIARVEGVREEYANRLAAQQDGLAAICRAAGWGFSIHRTDHPPEAALLSLYAALAPEPGRR
jgi:uncharacterized protein (DUF58 family)